MAHAAGRRRCAGHHRRRRGSAIRSAAAPRDARSVGAREQWAANPPDAALPARAGSTRKRRRAPMQAAPAVPVPARCRGWARPGRNAPHTGLHRHQSAAALRGSCCRGPPSASPARPPTAAPLRTPHARPRLSATTAAPASRRSRCADAGGGAAVSCGNRVAEVGLDGMRAVSTLPRGQGQAARVSAWPWPAPARYRPRCPGSATPIRCPVPSAIAQGPGGRWGPGRRCRCTCPWPVPT